MTTSSRENDRNDQSAERAERRALLWRRAALSTLVALAVFMSITTTCTVLLVRDTQVTNTARAKSTEQSAKDAARAAVAAESGTTLIRDCVTPGRPCFQRGQRQQADAVGDINRVVVLAAACASGPVKKSVQQIQSCVIDRLADD